MTSLLSRYPCDNCANPMRKRVSDRFWRFSTPHERGIQARDEQVSTLRPYFTTHEGYFRNANFFRRHFWTVPNVAQSNTAEQRFCTVSYTWVGPALRSNAANSQLPAPCSRYPVRPLISSTSGMNSAMTINPTAPPRNRINNGSISLVSPSVSTATSSS